MSPTAALMHAASTTVAGGAANGALIAAAFGSSAIGITRWGGMETAATAPPPFKESTCVALAAADDRAPFEKAAEGGADAEATSAGAMGRGALPACPPPYLPTLRCCCSARELGTAWGVKLPLAAAAAEVETVGDKAYLAPPLFPLWGVEGAAAVRPRRLGM